MVRATVFLAGALLMALEVTAFRVIGKTFGSALRETTAVIAVFMAAMSAGYWLGGRAGDRWPKLETLVILLLAATATMTFIPQLDSMLGPRITSSTIDYALHAFVATTLLFAIPTFLFAAVSPAAVRLFATTAGTSGSTAGSISAISTVGSIAGSIVTAFFLIDWLASVERTVIVIAIAAYVTAAALSVTTLMRPSVDWRRRGRFAFVVSAPLLLLIPAAMFVQSTRLDASPLDQASGWKTLFVGDSPYHRVTVREREGLFRLLSFSSGATQTRMLLANPDGPGNAYVDSVHLTRLMRPGMKRVLMIGLGGGTAPKQFLKYYEDVEVDAVEVDPLVVDVARRYFGVSPSPRLRIHVADGRMFLKHTRETWDLIIVDAYTRSPYGDTIPPHLVTREFFQEASGRLNDGGVLHFHCAFGGSKLFPALQKTIAQVFDSVLVVESEIVASDVPLITPKEVMSERARRSPAAELPHLQSQIALLRPAGTVAASVPLLTDDYAPVDRLLRGSN